MRQFSFVGFVLAIAFLVATRAEALVNGIDISANQGTITATGWQQIKASGVQFVFARVALGSCCDYDTQYASYFSNAIAAGIPIAPYSVGYPQTHSDDPNDAANEANYLITLTKSEYQGSGLMLRPVLDIELPTDGSLTKTFTSNWVVQWANTIKAGLGVDPIIYTYTSYAANELNSSVTSYPLWIASAAAAPPATLPANTYAPWSSYKFWQYSQGSVPGITGNVDKDVFNGTFQQMIQQYSPNYSNGDYNNNGIVDAADYVLWRNTMGNSINQGVGADGDLSGIIDAGDYTTWRTNFGKAVPNVPAGAGAGFSSVPEPASSFLLIIATLTALSRRTPRHQR